MSTTDGDAASRLDDAIAGVFEYRERSNGSTVPTPTTDDDWNVDGPDDTDDIDDIDDIDDTFTMPEIVPATAPAPAIGDRAPAPTPAPVPQAPAPTAPPRSTAPATAWGDHMAPVHAAPVATALRAPGRRPRVRRVTRVVRHVDPWSTFKLALLFSVVAYLVTLTAGVLLWRVADSTGTLDNVERWFTQFGWETFEFKGGEIFHNAWIIGLFGAVGLTGGLVLLATLFNLVSDIVGGIRVTVLEEEVVERTVSSTRRYVVRRPPVEAESASWDIEDSDDVEPTKPAPARSTTEWSVDDDDTDVDTDVDPATDARPRAGSSDGDDGHDDATADVPRSSG